VLPRSSFEYILKSTTNIIDVFIGARRVGKTSIMKNIISALLNSGIKPKQIVYFVADARISKDIVPEDIVKYMKNVFNLKSSDKIYLFLNRKGELTEVKFRNNITPEDLEKYQLISDEIRFIIKEQSEVFGNVLPMHSMTVLDEYLLQ